MKAAVFTAPGAIEYRELPDPTPGGSDVVVRVTGCGVCGSDVHIYHGQLTQGVAPPVVLGHEIAGVVEAVGSDVANVRPGENVCIDPVVTCGCCRYCRTARPNLCEDTRIIGYSQNGGYAQYTMAPASHVYPLAPGTPPAAGLLVETFACVLNGYDKLKIPAGGTALVIGAGTVGLLWISLLRSTPLAHIVVSEPVGLRRERAATLGANMLVDPAERDLAAAVTGHYPEGVDLVVDASGDPEAIQAGIRLVRKFGTFVIFGIAPPDADIRVNPASLYQKEMRIVASKMPPYSLQRAADMFNAGMIDHKMIVTDTMGLDQFGHALDLFESARDKHIKIAIDPWS